MEETKRTHFYKYFDYQGAFATLDRKQLRLSSVRLFNDPFDQRFNLNPAITTIDLLDAMTIRLEGLAQHRN